MSDRSGLENRKRPRPRLAQRTRQIEVSDPRLGVYRETSEVIDVAPLFRSMIGGMDDDIELSLKPTWPDVEDDYGLFWPSHGFGKWRIGRIGLAEEISGAKKWMWPVTLPLPIPPHCHGRA